MTKIAYGIDLAGYSTGRTGVARVERIDSDTYSATVHQDHSLSRKVGGDCLLKDIVSREVEVVREMLDEGAAVVLDVPIDISELAPDRPKRYVWQVTKRAVDRAFDALAPEADRLGGPRLRCREMLAALDPEGRLLGASVFESYPAASLALLFPEGKAIRYKSDNKPELSNLQRKLGFEVAADATLSEHDFDAILCGLCGVVDDQCVLQGNELQREIFKRLKGKKCIPEEDLEKPAIPEEPPRGYRLLRRNGSDWLSQLKVAVSISK